MRIALCHENVLPNRGGAEMYVADLARRLVAAGHELDLYACQWDATALPQSIRFHPLPKPRGPRFMRPWRFSAALRRELQTGQHDVSLGFDKVLGTDVYYPLGGLHVATAAHNLFKYPAGARRWSARIVQQLDLAHQSFLRFERAQLTGPNRPLLVVNSDLVRQHVRQYYGLDPTTIPVIHNAIDPDRFAEDDRPKVREEARREWNLETDDVVAATIAMNYRLKGLEPLLHAFAKTPAPLKLLVAGSRKTAPFEMLADRLGVRDRVRFIGHCADVRRVFFAADLLVHPTFYDPCSLVVLEAFSCGLPVITTAHNGAGELMHPPAEGFVIDDPHHLNALSSRLTEMLNPTRRIACGKSARHTAARWTFDHHVRAFEAVLRDASSRRARVAG